VEGNFFYDRRLVTSYPFLHTHRSKRNLRPAQQEEG